MAVVFFPRPSRRRDDWIDPDDDDAGARHYYLWLEAVSSSDDDDEEEDDDDGDGDQRPTARGRRRRRNRRHARRLVLEIPDDDDDEEEEESDDWNPRVHLGELPRRPMSRFHKAFIDVLFVVATVALEVIFVWTAVQQGDGADKVMFWFIGVPAMLLGMITILCIAAFVYVLVTRDFSWRPDPTPADEKV